MENETFIRLISFIGIFILMAGWETISPRRILTISKPKRWLSNLSLVFLNTLLVRVLFTLTPVGMASYAAEQGWGVLNTLGAPIWALIPLAVITLDFVIYLQHVMFHSIPLLWRIHMVHHTDLDFDVTTGNRFHPIEIILSMGIKTMAVILIGAPPSSVLIFEVLLNGTSMFNHSNVWIPKDLDRFLRIWIVTPDMHRVHHSIYVEETNSNFGFNLPWWDKIMGTYKAFPKEGHTEMTIGLTHYRNPKRITFPWLLGIPFIGGIGNYPLNRRDE